MGQVYIYSIIYMYIPKMDLDTVLNMLIAVLAC